MSLTNHQGCYRVTQNGIYGFFNEHRFLSNFEPCIIVYDGMIFTSTEAAFQCAKTLNPLERHGFEAMTPSQSKAAGRKVTLREDWNKIRDNVMLDVLRIKFMNNPELMKKLLDTEEKYLEETNWWGDTYWGVCDGVGENKLGKLLMQVRTELKPLKQALDATQQIRKEGS